MHTPPLDHKVRTTEIRMIIGHRPFNSPADFQGLIGRERRVEPIDKNVSQGNIYPPVDFMINLQGLFYSHLFRCSNDI